ncbi:MAG: SAM-dependent methyltransferase, partial [Bacteroidetes bacterium]
MKRLQILFRFIKYYFRAKTRYNIHSPFVYAFAEEVLDDDRWYYAFKDIELLRQLLLTEKTVIEVTDLGAGSQVVQGNRRTVRSLVKYSATAPVFCRILFRMVRFLKPQNIIELGTSLGISTLYQARAALNGQIFTIEGCPNIAAKARQNFELMKADNIVSLIGPFEDHLPALLQKLEKVDYVFVDGNHRKAPTLEYFRLCAAEAHPGTVLVFDDIHWSTEMEEAWREIQNDSRVTLTIDLFFFGIVFFKKEFRVKQHYTLIRSW